MDSTPVPARTTFDPVNLGIYLRFIVKGGDLGGGAVINTRLWNHATASGEAVGDCRRCGHPMQALATHQAGQITWYGARCANSPCGAEIAAPNAEMLIRSSRVSEQPHSFSSGRKK